MTLQIPFKNKNETSLDKQKCTKLWGPLNVYIYIYIKIFRIRDVPFSEFYGLPQNNKTLVVLGAPLIIYLLKLRCAYHATQIQNPKTSNKICFGLWVHFM